MKTPMLTEVLEQRIGNARLSFGRRIGRAATSEMSGHGLVMMSL